MNFIFVCMVLEKLRSAQFKAMNLVQISNSFLLRAAEITENTFNLHFYTHTHTQKPAPNSGRSDYVRI